MPEQERAKGYAERYGVGVYLKGENTPTKPPKYSQNQKGFTMIELHSKTISNVISYFEQI